MNEEKQNVWDWFGENLKREMKEEKERKQLAFLNITLHVMAFMIGFLIGALWTN